VTGNTRLSRSNCEYEIMTHWRNLVPLPLVAVVVSPNATADLLIVGSCVEPRPSARDPR
jgi:hypothetical protein